MRLAADLQLQRRDLGQEGGVGAGRHPELESGDEDRRGEVVAEHLQDRAGPLRSGRQVLRRRRELGTPHLGHVQDGGDHEVLLGREVVQLGTSADTGPLAHERGRRAGVPLLDQQLDGRLEQPGPHGAGALLLRDARHRRLAGHRFMMACTTTNSQL